MTRNGSRQKQVNTYRQLATPTRAPADTRPVRMDEDELSTRSLEMPHHDDDGWFHAKIKVRNSLHWANNYVIQFGMAILFLAALVTTLYVTNQGKDVAVGLLSGGCVTIVSSTAIIFTYCKYPTWRKHPNSLIFYRSICDLGFVLVLIITELQKCSQNDKCVLSTYLKDTSNSKGFGNTTCTVAAGFTQFFLFGSESWFFVMAIDMYKSMRSPFTDFKRNVRMYHFFVWGACKHLNSFV